MEILLVVQQFIIFLYRFLHFYQAAVARCTAMYRNISKTFNHFSFPSHLRHIRHLHNPTTAPFRRQICQIRQS